MKRLATFLPTTLAGCLMCAAAAAATEFPDGALDPRFGKAGIALASFELSTEFADRTQGIAVAPSGRLYLAASIGAPVQGVTRVRPGLVRFFADGQLDNAFSGDGVASPVANALASQNLWASGVVVRTDGQPMVYGYRFPGGGARAKLLVCRYAVAGNLDPSFDGDGCAEPTLALIDNGEEMARTALLLADNRLLLGGLAGINPQNPDHADALVLLLNSDGSIAASFGTGGHTLLRPPASTYSQVVELVRLGDGRFIAIGLADVGMFAARLSPGGLLDTSFGNNGYTVLSFDDLHSLPLTVDWAQAGAVDSQGRIYLCGHLTYGNNSSQSVMAFARLTPDGLADASFSGDARILRPFIDVFPTSNVVDCAVDPQDRLVAAVRTGTLNPTSSDYGAIRFLPDGSEDPRFGAAGQTRVAIDFGGPGVGHDAPAGFALIGNDLILAGTSYPSNDNGTTVGEVHTLVRLGNSRLFGNGFEDN